MKGRKQNKCTEYAAASICKEKNQTPENHHLKAELAKDVTEPGKVLAHTPPKKSTCNHCRFVSVHTRR